MVGKFKTVFQMIAIVLFAVKRSYMVGTLGEAFGDFLWSFSWIIMLIALALTIASMVDYLVKAREVIGLGSLSASGKHEPLPSDAASLRIQAEELSGTVIESAKEKGLLIATAESLTGGMIGSLLTSVPGSSAVYKGGVVSYTNAVKEALLEVDEETLQDFGAVSEQTAEQMAKGARLSIGADVAVSVTGLAGPDGDEFGNPVGTVWVGVSTADATQANNHLFTGDRETIRLQTSIAALEAILDAINAQ